MNKSEVSCADDLANLAREALADFRANKQFRDLLAAILMANHLADWHFLNDLKRPRLGKRERETMTLAYPEWDVLRQLANGTKHCEMMPKLKKVEWEDRDFWPSPGHVGGDGIDWYVDFQGEARSVAILLDGFLNKFADASARPT